MGTDRDRGPVRATALRGLLRSLQWEHPTVHPHTLACLAMTLWGVEVSGARVKELLRREE